MSAAEEFFGPLPEDPLEAAFYSSGLDDETKSTDLIADLWAHEEAVRQGLFAQVHRQFDRIHRNYRVDGKTPSDWQSFHNIPGEGNTYIWVVNHALPANEFTHVLRCRVTPSSLRYSEYGVSKAGGLWASTHAEAERSFSDDPWLPEELGKCALIQLQGNHVALFRGVKNAMPWLNQQRGPLNDPLGRLDASEHTKREFNGLITLLGQLSSVTHEPYASGNLS